MKDQEITALPLNQLEQLLARAKAASGTSDPVEGGRVARVGRDGVLCASSAEEWIWFLTRLSSNGYNISSAWRLSGALNSQALRRALDRIVWRHEALRTTFEMVDGELRRRIAVEPVQFAMQEHDLRETPDELDALKAAEVRAAFDLSAGPLARGRLIRLAESEHVLLVTMHHLVSDGWSMAVFGRELGALYTAYCRGEADPLPALAVQYADYAVWQRQWLSSEATKAHREYWRRTLVDAPLLSSFPTDSPRPMHQTYDGGFVEVELDEDLTRRLKALSQRHGTTLYMTLLAAWAVLLSRLSGQEDVIVGTPVANRTREEVMPLIGLFVNVLALRFDVSGSPGVGGFLRRVKDQVLRARRHQELPFDRVVEAVNPSRSASFGPLFQILFSWVNDHGAGLEMADLVVSAERRTYEGAGNFDLALSIGESGRRIAGVVEYSTGLFERATIERYIGYFRSVLDAMVGDDQADVGRIGLLSAAERQRALVEWNDTARDYPKDACVHELFEQQVEKTPHAVAVVFDTQRLTYGELDVRANRLAHRLIEKGVKSGDCVATLLERGIDLVVAQLAILKAGGTYVPVDVQAPAVRRAWIVADCGARVVLTDATHAAGANVGPETLLVERALAEAEGVAKPERVRSSQDAAYVMYTSGSTGTPKGVAVTHKAVNRLVLDNGYAEFTPTDRIAWVGNPAFDISTLEVWAPLLNGACMVVVARETLLDPQALRALVQQQQVTVLHLTAGLFHQAVDILGDVLSDLRLLLVGGDLVDASAVRRVLERHRPQRLLHCYGPTESTTFATTYAVSDVDEEVSRLPIGRPISNTRVYVLDHHGEPVPQGAVGELYIGGDGVALGYLNRPELTAERFVPDRFSATPGARMYRTGDLARHLPDGNLEFLGRNDSQVKLRGYRIELGEIEARLSQHPHVKDVVVVANGSSAGDKRLVAYVTTVAGTELDALPAGELVAALRRHVSEQLPDYMVPAAFVRLDALPLTPNGKLDRRALPAPDSDAVAKRAFEAPQGEIEETLAGIWAELLGVEKVGRRDNFFELGGHSLLAVRLMSRVHGVLGVELPIAMLFARPALAGQAEATSEVLARKGARALAPIVRVSRDEPLEPSYAQQRLWFMAQLDGVSTTYHMPAALRLRGALDVGAWRRSLDALVARHEALRTVFVSDEGQPRMQLLPATCRFELLEYDLEHEPDAEKRLEQLCDEEADAPFDLARGPLIRGRLVRMAPQEHVFLLTQHHIVSDGWSMGVLVDELSALYRGFVAGQEEVLQPLTMQYPDYAAWQRQWLSGERLQAQEAYWRRSLAGAPALLELPTDRPRPAQQSFAGAMVDVNLDAELTAGLKRLRQQHGTTLFMTVLSAWATVLGRLAGQDDVVIGTPTANRNRQEIEGLIGFFVNTLALRIDLSGEPCVAELLSRVRATALGAQEHQDLPFEKVVEIVQPARRLDVSPVVQVMFAWQGDDERALELPGLSVELVSGRPDTVKFDLELTLAEANGGIVGTLGYSTALFDQATIERHCGYVVAVLRAMVADASRAVSRIELIGPAERQRLIGEWNDTARDYPKDACIHELFEQRVEKTPDALAVVVDQQALTYGELNARANRLAYRLLEMGLEPGDCVATLLERGIDLVVAQLAILKAGSTYVPVDVQAPAVRQTWMVADCGARVVLTDTTHAAGANVGAEMLLVEAALAEAASDANPALVQSSQDAAYVMYTSGSTGTPKGVVVTHQAVNRLVLDNGYAEFTSTDRIAWVGNPAFDISTLEVWAPLLNGACMVVVSREMVLDPQALRALVQQQQVTVLHLTAGLFHQTVDILGDVLPDLRLLLVGGDLVDAGAVRRVLHRYRPQRLLHCYGPTESTTFATTYAVNDVDEQVSRLPIGRPISNTRLYVLDRCGEPVPQGAVGELYIGGDGVAHGYLNRPELTAERFVADPFSATPGARMYRTGDLARHLPDGNLEFLGRNDSQVKLRGYRIELGEIEARLSQHPHVKDAVVVAREDVAGEKRLVAYVTTSIDADAPAADLVGGWRRHLAEQLPEYMVPSAFVRLDALPLTPNGKLDRKALPAPDGVAVVKRAYEAPQGDVEQKLAVVWAELLGLEKVGRHDNFFELGGHSLLAVQMMERLRRLGLSAEVRALFARPTLAALAEMLGRQLDVAVPANGITPGTTTISPEMLPLVTLTQADVNRIVALVPGGAGNIQDIYALSPLQEGIWFHHLLARQGDPYLVAVQVAFPERGLLDRYLAAVQRVVNRHDILRTAFVWEGQSMPAQVVWRRAPLSVTEIVLESRDAVAAREELAKRYDPRQYRMELTKAPLLQFVIAKEPGSERWLVLELTHHLIGDHSTLEILHREVVALLEGREHELAPPEPYRNLVAHARLGASQDEHERFFTRLLGDIDEPTTPFGLREVHRDGENVGESRRVLAASLNDRLRGQARRLGVSVASLCHLAWGQVVAKTSGREQVVFGTVLFGRMHGGVGAEQTMGLYINTLPVRLSLGKIGVEDAVRQVHDVLAELLRHEHASLVLAQRCSGVAAGEPLFSALFNYRHNTAIAEDDEARRDVLYSVELVGAEERTNYPLLMSVEDFGESLGLTAQVVEPISPERVCDFMQRALEQLADGLESAPQSPVRALDVLPAAERQRLLVEWNDTRADYPKDACVHELFEEQVARTPGAVAVVFENDELTYAELDAKANRLAHQLRRMGVGPDSRVAICVERSVEMVVGIVGILKAGGAYVPLDPAYPSSRLAHMLGDSQSMALLVRGQVPLAVQEALHGGIALWMPVIDLATDLARSADAPVTAVKPAEIGLAGNHLTYVIYTSGTTGMPKGVALPHSAAVNLIRWQTGTTEPRTTLQYAALGFDVSFQEIFSALCSGAKLVLIDSATRHDPQKLFQIIRSRRVERLFLPCVALQMLAESADRDSSAADCGLREVITAGEQLKITPSIARLFRSLEGCRLHNHYGPSETHVVTAFALPDNVAEWPTLPPIGRPIANTSIYVLDAHGAPVPQGVVGELYLGGEGVARGYLNRPELTAERFLKDPFSTKPGARMYRTGDLARYLPDGNLEFLGRNDFQVKVRGYRIELGEIEARLSQHPHVKGAVVVAREDSPGDKRLVAYVTTAAGGPADVSASELVVGWRRHLAEQLPEYMVPSAFVRLESLPLTPNGKLDRKALPAPDGEAVMTREYEAPKGDVEAKVAEVWAELFGMEKVGRQDNFFELGGHSLLAATLIERLRRLGLTTPVASVFEKPILADLARRISDPSASPGADAVPVRRTGASTPIFFVPSGLGDVSYVFELAKELDDDLPVYALPWQNGRARGLNPTLETLAADMVALIQAVQPRGPYRVVGYSSGGLLAYAIAQHLLRAGEPVSFVGLIDTPAPDVFTVPMPAKEPMLQHIRGLPLDGHVRAHLEQLRDDLSFLEMALECRRLGVDGFADARPLADDWERAANYSRLIASYDPPSLAMTAHVFLATEAVKNTTATDALDETPYAKHMRLAASKGPILEGWQGLLPSVQSVPVPGNHITMMTAAGHRKVLGAGISEALRTPAANGPDTRVPQ